MSQKIASALRQGQERHVRLALAVEVRSLHILRFHLGRLNLFGSHAQVGVWDVVSRILERLEVGLVLGCFGAGCGGFLILLGAVGDDGLVVELADVGFEFLRLQESRGALFGLLENLRQQGFVFGVVSQSFGLFGGVAFSGEYFFDGHRFS